MEKYVTNNSLYLVGSMQDVITELRELARKYHTLEEVINIYLN